MRPEFVRSSKYRLARPDQPPCRPWRQQTGEWDPARHSPAVTTQPPLAAHIGAGRVGLRKTPRPLTTVPGCGRDFESDADAAVICVDALLVREDRLIERTPNEVDLVQWRSPPSSVARLRHDRREHDDGT
jgi:hypothetical protein